MDILTSFIDPSLLGGFAAVVVVAGVIVSFMRYSFASQEIEYGEHISTLYGTNAALKSKAVKAAEKKKRAKLAKANHIKLSAAGDTPDNEQYGQHRVEINPEPIILGENDTTAQGHASDKTKPRRRTLSKPILHNKDEVPLIQSGEVESRLEFTANAVPVDEAEMLHRRQSQQQSEKPAAKVTGSNVVEDSLPTIEVIEDAVLPVKSANVNAGFTQTTDRDRADSTNQKSSDDSNDPGTDSARKSSKKSKSKATAVSNGQPSPVKDTSKVEDMLDSIGQSALSKPQLQQLVNTLVTAHGGETWERKGKLAELTKQLQSLQSALDNERTNLAWTSDQLKEANNKLSLAERNNNGVSSKLQEMQVRLGQSLDQHRAEVQGIQQARFQEIQRMQQHIQQVREENQSLRQALPNTDEVVQMRNQLRALESELKDQQRHVVKSEAKCQDLNSRLNSANEAYRQENMRCEELVSRADELSFKHTRLEKQLTDTQTRAHAAENDLRNIQDHLRTKDLEIKELHTEILSAKQTATETISSTSQADNSKIQQLEESVASLQKSVDSKQSEIADLLAQLSQTREDLENAVKVKSQSNGTAAGESQEDQNTISQLEHELLKLQSEIETVRDKNNELRRKNCGMSESLQKAEAAALSTSLLESDLEKKSSHVHELKACNQTLKESNSELQSKMDILTNADSHTDQLQREYSQLRHALADKDDIIHSLELSLADEKDKVTPSSSQSDNKVRTVMRKLQPNLALDSSLTLEQSMGEFYKQAVLDAKLENLEENQYKQTLIETEAMLDKLSETWQGKLDDKDSQISGLQTELAEYQTKLHNISLSSSQRSSSEHAVLRNEDTGSTSNSSEHAVLRNEDTDSTSNSSEAMRLASSGSLQDVSSTV